MLPDGLRERILNLWLMTGPLDDLVTQDALFVVTSTGSEARGPVCVADMIDYFFRRAFDARLDVTNTVFTPESAVVEAGFSGTHTGDFGGMPATGRAFDVPVCIVYDLRGDKISGARVYLQISRLISQLEVEEDSA